MKTTKVLFAAMVVFSFIFLAYSFVFSTDGQIKPLQGITVQPAPIVLCPSGWHQIKNTSEEFKCAPNKPTPIKCPEGWKYIEALDCKLNPGSTGTQINIPPSCSGCVVGCLKIPVIK